MDKSLSQSLRNENDLLKCQLNDLITREKNQRLDLQRLRQHLDTEVASLVQAGTSQLQAQVEQLKSLLQSTSCQLLQALTDKEEARKQMEQSIRAQEETKQSGASQEASLVGCIQSLDDALHKGVGFVTALADNVCAFQHHVLPNFKAPGFEAEVTLTKDVHEDRKGELLLEELTRLEKELSLLRVIVDAKNDTLVLIRGKLKHENEELNAELRILRESKQKTQQSVQTTHDGASGKNSLRQEFHALQEIFNEELNQLRGKLRKYEAEEQHGESHASEVEKELATLRQKLDSVEASKVSLDVSLKEETAARSQLLSELVILRKEHEKTKTELETVKLNQKFLVRQPRNGRIAPEKMDLMNTVNQLLQEVNKAKSEKVSLEEELKSERRFQVRERLKRDVTARDVELAASNKVGDSELASRLARARLLSVSVPGDSLPSTPVCTEGLSSMMRRPVHITIDLPSRTTVQNIPSASCCSDMPRENLAACSGLSSGNLATKTV